MPASEKTWRKLPLLHLVFGISSVAMLLSTLWMLAADHNREWKPYQNTYRRIQRVVLDRRIAEQETLQYNNELAEAQAALALALTDPPAAERVAEFRAELIVHNLFQPSIEAQTPDDYLQVLNEKVSARLKQLGVQAEADRKTLFDKLAKEDAEYLKAVSSGQTAPQQGFADKLRSSGPGQQIATAYTQLVRDLGAFGKKPSADQIEAVRKRRAQFKSLLEDIYRPVNDEFNLASRNLKFVRADRDAANSAFQLAITGGEPQAEVDRLEGKLKELEARIAMMDLRLQEVKLHREALQTALKEMDAGVALAEKKVADLQDKIKKLEEARQKQEPNALLEYPIVDAFNSPVKIEQLWCPDLKVNYNLAWVARFDRCITCHQGIDKTAPGSAVLPFLEARTGAVSIKLPTPKERPAPDYDALAKSGLPLSKESAELRTAYGLDLAETGLISPTEVTISVVWDAASAGRNGFPATAVKAGLESGDVIEAINGTKLTSRDQAIRYLLEDVTWGEPLELKILRGVPHPYASHPRLDLYLGSFSPHPVREYGCTVCHGGQGSATAFKWASHSPNDPAQRMNWENKHGWFSNHNWPFHMRPERFVESNCIRCHHEVTELEASERFPDPPAPKVTHGHELIRRYGCFGCHEINGFDGHERIGPDLRTEPLYFAAAQQLLADEWLHKDGDEQAKIRKMANHVVRYPEDTQMRKQLGEWIQADAHAAQSVLSGRSHEMASLLSEDNDTPGKFRRVGPSLRYVASKVGADFLFDWIKNPQHFRPSTRMPRFFGLHNHLPGPPAITAESVKDWSQVAEALTSARTDDPAGRIWELLPEADRPLVAVAGKGDGNKAKRAQRKIAAALTELYDNKDLYEPAAFSSLEVKGDVGYFFRTAEGGAVLKQPVPALSYRELQWLNRLLIEAAFPGQFISEPEGEQDKSRLDSAFRYETVEVLGAVNYLLSYSQPFKYDPLPSEPGSVERGRAAFETRGCLACHSLNDPEAEVKGKADHGPNLQNLGAKFQGEQGKQWLYTWVRDPNRYHARTVMPNLYLEPIETKDADGKVTGTTDPAADIVAYLLSFKDWKPYPLPKLDDGDPADMQALDDVVMLYLQKSYPKRQARRYVDEGIPVEAAVGGDEAELAGPISTDKKLRYVGRKTIGRLGCFGCHDIPGYEQAKPIGTGLNSWGVKLTAQLAFEQIGTYLGTGHGHGAEHPAHAEVPSADAPGADGEPEDDTGYYLESLTHHHREGFIWQKLRAPRSYDFEMTAHKGYDERLRMPRFPLSYEEREAVITFVLGLVADPAQSKGPQYIYQPDRRNDSIEAGKRVIEKYNCKGCHMFQAERWVYEYDPAVVAANNAPDSDSLYKVAPVSSKEDFEVLHPYFSPDELKKSQQTDRRGLARVEISGRKIMQEVEDDDGNIYFYYELWKPAAIAGIPFRATQTIPIRDSQLVPEEHREPDGGYLARLLHPYVLAKEKQKNPNAKDIDAWAWVPPPLMREGEKVQTEWLYRFLLDPRKIRPAVVLRMPRFNMSPVEARQLVNYFAAVDRVEYPYGNIPERDPEYLHQKFAEYPNYFSNAFKIVADAKSGCTQCHYVGDFVPGGNPTAHGPNLANVYERIRPEFLTRWLSRPKELLPYTGMPANFPNETPDKLAHQDKFKGPPTVQIRAVRDLLLNFDHFDRKSVKDQVKLPPPADAAGGGGE